MNTNLIQEDILNILKQKNTCIFGDIVKASKHSYNDVLINLIELESTGKITRANSYQYQITQ